MIVAPALTGAYVAMHMTLLGDVLGEAAVASEHSRAVGLLMFTQGWIACSVPVAIGKWRCVM